LNLGIVQDQTIAMSGSAEFSADDDRWEELMGRDVMILRLVRCSGESSTIIKLQFIYR